MSAFFNHMLLSMLNGDVFAAEPNPNLPANRFKIETAPGEIQNRTWPQIMEVCDQFKASHPNDQQTFNYRGFECQILFCLSHFNGYIRMTQAQRDWFGANRDRLEEIQPHGGITCENAAESAPGFGFDCAHMGDQQINPLSRTGPMFEGANGRESTFKTPEYVAHELRQWADHLTAILPPELA